METCTNCGAALRPGARFCTICGTRLNTAQEPPNSAWVPTPASAQQHGQQTAVVESVQPTVTEPTVSITGGDAQREYNRWTSAYASPSTPTDDPASRFISALEQTPVPVPADSPAEPEKPGEQPRSVTTWVTPPPDAFSSQTPSSPNNDPTGSGERSETEDANGWRAPSTWASVAPTSSDDEADSPGVIGADVRDRDEFAAWGETSLATDLAIDSADETDNEVHEDTGINESVSANAATAQGSGAGEVDGPDAGERPNVTEADTPTLSPDDARARAISLADELQRMIRMMPGGGTQDPGAAAMALTEASLKVSNFADVREAIRELQDDPRDIQALSNLARMADKIELLLNEHQALADVIETALQELSGHN